MMKKIFVLFLAVLIVALFSTASFASCKTGQTDKIPLDSGGKADVKLSANVEASYCSNGSSYAAVTYNSKGMGRSYGTASDTTYIYYTTGDKTSGWSATNASDAKFTSGWTQIGE